MQGSAKSIKRVEEDMTDAKSYVTCKNPYYNLSNTKRTL